MDASTLVPIALGILALAAVAFFAVFRGKGKLELKGPGGVSLKAKGENPPPPAAVPAGVKIKDVETGQNVHACSSGLGGVVIEKVKAKGGIDATHLPGKSSPKG